MVWQCYRSRSLEWTIQSSALHHPVVTCSLLWCRTTQVHSWQHLQGTSIIQDLRAGRYVHRALGTTRSFSTFFTVTRRYLRVSLCLVRVQQVQQCVRDSGCARFRRKARWRCLPPFGVLALLLLFETRDIFGARCFPPFQFCSYTIFLLLHPIETETVGSGCADWFLGRPFARALAPCGEPQVKHG